MGGPRDEVGVVVIGRNEGDRLRQAIESVRGQVAAIIYVDSGSTDGSVELARSTGVEVVELDMSIGFTAARARNAGVKRLVATAPTVRYVQFVDGDCRVMPGWIETAHSTLEKDDQLVAVCGRRREERPGSSIYNRLCDMEWNTPIGITRSCGGDVLIRLEALQKAGGYRPTMIAGEEPELCLRLRRAGGRILRVDVEMTLHDANMTSFWQWWKRTTRAGHAYAEGAWIHRFSGDRHNVRELLSILSWGLVLPILIAGLAWPTRGAAFLLLVGYLVLWFRVRAHRRGDADASLYASFCVIGKIAEVVGVLRFLGNCLLGRQGKIIEIKTQPDMGTAAAEERSSVRSAGDTER